MQSLDLVVGHDLAAVLMIRVHPDGLDTGVDAALNVGAEAVAYDHSLLQIKIVYI